MFDILVVRGICGLWVEREGNKEKWYDRSECEYRFDGWSVEFERKVWKRIEKRNVFGMFVRLIRIKDYCMKEVKIEIGMKI